MTCLICGDAGRYQKIRIIGRTVVRLLCDPCKEWLQS